MATPTRTLLPTKEAAAYCGFKTPGALRRAAMEGRGVHLAGRQFCITAAVRGEDETIEDVARRRLLALPHLQAHQVWGRHSPDGDQNGSHPVRRSHHRARSPSKREDLLAACTA